MHGDKRGDKGDDEIEYENDCEIGEDGDESGEEGNCEIGELSGDVRDDESRGRKTWVAG